MPLQNLIAANIMNKTIRYFAVALVLVAGFLLMMYMQQRFDNLDLRKAIEAVQEVHSPGNSSTLKEQVAERYAIPADQIHWSAVVASKVWGTVWVTAEIPGSSDQLRWKVDVSRQQVMPESEPAQSLLQPE